MSQSRVDALVARLEKGRQKTAELLSALPLEKWQLQVYTAPDWSVTNLLAHFVSSEEQLLVLARDIANGGQGAPQGFDIHAFNAQEQERLSGKSTQTLLNAMNDARQQTIDWVRTLDDNQLNLAGQHPALGCVSLETMITAIYGHQLLHMRELIAKLGGR